MKKNNSHEDLVAWQKGHQLTLDVFRTVNNVDPVLFEFMKESALRIVSQIAEGINKYNVEDKITHLEQAKGASARLSTQIILSGELSYISKEHSELLYAKAMEVYKMISGLIKYLRSNAQKKQLQEQA